jgi:hypothetical protein
VANNHGVGVLPDFQAGGPFGTVYIGDNVTPMAIGVASGGPYLFTVSYAGEVSANSYYGTNAVLKSLSVSGYAYFTNPIIVGQHSMIISNGASSTLFTETGTNVFRTRTNQVEFFVPIYGNGVGLTNLNGTNIVGTVILTNSVGMAASVAYSTNGTAQICNFDANQISQFIQQTNALTITNFINLPANGLCPTVYWTVIGNGSALSWNSAYHGAGPNVVFTNGNSTVNLTHYLITATAKWAFTTNAYYVTCVPFGL